MNLFVLFSLLLLTQCVLTTPRLAVTVGDVIIFPPLYHCRGIQVIFPFYSLWSNWFSRAIAVSFHTDSCTSQNTQLTSFFARYFESLTYQIRYMYKNAFCVYIPWPRPQTFQLHSAREVKHKAWYRKSHDMT